MDTYSRIHLITSLTLPSCLSDKTVHGIKAFCTCGSLNDDYEREGLVNVKYRIVEAAVLKVLARNPNSNIETLKAALLDSHTK